MPEAVRRVLERLAAGDRSTLLGLHAILHAADERGIAKLHDVAIQYRDDTLAAMRADGRDADREAGLLGVDQATANLVNTVLPRLIPEGLVAPGPTPGDVTAACDLGAKCAQVRDPQRDHRRQFRSHLR